MRFSVSRLCGGKALMLTSSPNADVGMDKAFRAVSDIGEIKERDDMMIVFLWKEMEVTFYPQGKIMFHPLEDADAAVKYASYILGKIADAE